MTLAWFLVMLLSLMKPRNLVTLLKWRMYRFTVMTGGGMPFLTSFMCVASVLL